MISFLVGVLVLSLLVFIHELGHFLAAKGLKISSLSSLIGLGAFIISSYLIYPEVPGISSHAPIWIITFIITYKHIPNIVRLFKKEEASV